MSDAVIDEREDARPIVPTSGASNLGLYAFVAVLVIGGIWLFSTLNSAREDGAPTAAEFEASAPRIASPAPLQLPPVGTGRREPVLLEALPPEPEQFDPPRAPLPPPPVAAPFVSPAPPPARFDTPAPPPATPTPVFERAFTPEADGREGTPASEAVSPTRIANPSWTVTQGTVIPAVLETAFDSTRPGRVRALVQRDVFSFDGSRVLIPRGSRLFGEYEAGLAVGESRALITWTRLMRPDGVSIALESPASDPLGRGGVEGDVDSRFWDRLGDGLLNSVLGLGVGLVAGEVAGGSTILALPGSTQNVSGGSSRNIRPVLEIDHGTSVSVYVARDLDFSSLAG